MQLCKGDWACQNAFCGGAPRPSTLALHAAAGWSASHRAWCGAALVRGHTTNPMTTFTKPPSISSIYPRCSAVPGAAHLSSPSRPFPAVADHPTLGLPPSHPPGVDAAWTGRVHLLPLAVHGSYQRLSHIDHPLLEGSCTRTHRAPVVRLHGEHQLLEGSCRTHRHILQYKFLGGHP